MRMEGIVEARFVGIDVGKARCRTAIMDHKGVIVDEFSFENTPRGIDELMGRLYERDSVVMESTGNLWLNIYNTLDSKGIRVVLANPIR